jgi:RNA polymerase sigma factor (sigma-70 family)
LNILPQFIIEDDDTDLLYRFTAYIRQVVIYARLEYLRKLDYRKHERPLEEFPSWTFIHEDSPITSKNDFTFEEEKLSQAFSELNLLRQRILTLIYVKGLSAKETADKLGCSVDYVYLQKHRALKNLRDQLIGEGGGHGK